MPPTTGWCPTCGATSVVFPVEPLYEPEAAASLVPCTSQSLMRLLQRHKGELPEPHYRIWRRHRYRLISATEIQWARAHLIRRRAKWPKEGRHHAAPTPSETPGSGATGDAGRAS